MLRCLLLLLFMCFLQHQNQQIPKSLCFFFFFFNLIERYLPMTNKEEVIGTSSPTTLTIECCMCGDYGLSYELFQCKLCRFRSQHRYCSNLYPKAESYQFCNWCLTKEKGGTAKGTHDSSSASSYKNNGSSTTNLVVKVQRSNSTDYSRLQLNNNNNSPMAIKKQKCLDHQLSPGSAGSGSGGRKRINIVVSSEEESLRRTKSEEIIRNKAVSSTSTTKQVFRGKAVRRYKLLEEVSS